MFRNLSKDMAEITSFLNRHPKSPFKETTSLMSRYKLSTSENPKDVLKKLFDSLKPQERLILTEIIVYDEDAYLNSLAYTANSTHRRFFTVREIMDFCSEYADLEFFMNVRDSITLKQLAQNAEKDIIDNVINEIASFPESIKEKLCIKEKDNNPYEISPNVGIFIFVKK